MLCNDSDTLLLVSDVAGIITIFYEEIQCK